MVYMVFLLFTLKSFFLHNYCSLVHSYFVIAKKANESELDELLQFKILNYLINKADSGISHI